MIPKNEAYVQRHDSAKEVSWMDRMQQKLESFCEIEPARNSNHLLQETSAYFEKQMSSVGTNVRKFCAEFVKELLLPETADKADASDVNTLQPETGLITGSDKLSKLASPGKVEKAPIFDPEGSISGSLLENEAAEGLVTDVEKVKEHGYDAVAPLAVGNACSPDDALPAQTVCEQSTQKFLNEEEPEQEVHWFVSEEDRKLTIGKSTSTSSLQSYEDLQRAPSTDSLLDWELV